MRVLIDECMPSQLRSWLSSYHDTSTLRDMGWEGLKNGRLLRAANAIGVNDGT